MDIIHANADELPTPSVSATLPALGGLLQWLAPELEVYCLLPDGAEPHHFQLGARQIERIRSGALLVRSSRDDLSWFKTRSSGIQQEKTLDIWSHTQQGERHAWLLPQAVLQKVPEINAALIQHFPQLQPSINARHAVLQSDLQRIQAAWKKPMQMLAKRGVIMQHPSWLPLLEAFQVPVLSVLEANNIGHSHGYNAKLLDHALQQLQANPHAILIADRRHDNKGLQWLKRKHPESTIVYLDPLGDCEQSWPQLMQRNIELLMQALRQHEMEPSDG